MPSEHSRRTFLRISGLSIPVAYAGLAGCSGPPGIAGDSAGRSLRYPDWLYEPGTVTDADFYRVSRLAPAAIDELEDELSAETFETLEGLVADLDFLDLDFDEMTELVVIGGAARVVAGDYDVEDVVEELEDNDFDDEDELEEYVIYLDDEDELFAVGVSDHHLVVGQRTSAEDADEVVEALIDTSIGEEDRYADENDAVAELTSLLPDGAYLTIAAHDEQDETVESRGQFDHAIGWGVSADLAEDTTELTWAVAFDDEDDVDTGAVEEWAGEALEDFDDVAVRADGAAALVEAAVDTDAFTAYASLPSGHRPWSTFQFDNARTGFNPVAPDVDPPVEFRWRFETDNAVFSSPAVVDGTVYVGSRDWNVYAIDEGDGAERWRFGTDNEVWSSPAVVDDTVYVGSWDNSVYAIARDNGAERWRFETGDLIFSSPMVVDDTVYIGSVDRNVYAIDANGGGEVWRYETGGGIFSSPSVVDGTVYVGSDDGNLYALDAANGTERWRYQIGSQVEPAPTVLGDSVYLGSGDQYVYAIDRNDGQERWRYGTDDWISSSPAVREDTVYIGGWDGVVYALTASDGDLRWRYETSGEIVSSPAVTGETVYIGSGDGNVYAIGASDGNERWQFATDATVWSSPAVVNGSVYIGSDDGRVYRLDGGGT